MKIDNCYKCGEAVLECTEWDISLSDGFTCETCNYKNQLTDEQYYKDAAWLKSLSKGALK